MSATKPELPDQKILMGIHNYLEKTEGLKVVTVTGGVSLEGRSELYVHLGNTRAELTQKIQLGETTPPSETLFGYPVRTYCTLESGGYILFNPR